MSDRRNKKNINQADHSDDMCEGCNSKEEQKKRLLKMLIKHGALIDNNFYARAVLQTDREKFKEAFKQRLKSFDDDYHNLTVGNVHVKGYGVTPEGYGQQMPDRSQDEKLREIENDYFLLHSGVENNRANFGENPDDFLDNHGVKEVADKATNLYISFKKIVNKIIEFLDRRAVMHGIR